MSEQDAAIPIIVITGSVRPGNFTSKAAAVVVDELAQDEHVSVEFVDAAQLDLPLPGSGGDGTDVERLRDKVAAAAGVVLVTPEYHGSYSSVMKLIIDNLGFPSVLGGKPIALVGVAAGAIGAIKALEHLRSVCSHIGAIVLPGPVSVAGVMNVFDEDGNCLDDRVEQRVRGVATALIDYIKGAICPAMTLERLVRE